MTTTYNQLLDGLKTGSMLVRVNGKRELLTSVSSIERESGSGKTFNVYLINGKSYFVTVIE